MERADILIVDDMPENLQLLARMLKEKEYKVRALPSGALAIKSVEIHPPDLILLDISMPKMDGYTVCRRIKEIKGGDKIPIIFISAKTNAEEIIRGFEMGAVDYITKPFNSLEVYQRIKTQLRLRNNERELEELLSGTVTGSIKAILEVMAFIDPDLYSKSNRLGRLMKKIVDEMSLEDAWMYETAALMSNIGDVLNSGRVVKHHSEELEELRIDTSTVEKNRRAAAEVIENIPRMSNVAYMIDGAECETCQTEQFDNYATKNKGIILLKIIEKYDVMNASGDTSYVIRQTLFREFSNYSEIVQILLDIVQEENSREAKLLNLYEIVSGYITVEDIKSRNGIKLVGKGTLLTSNLLGVLKRYSKREGIVEPIIVRKE